MKHYQRLDENVNTSPTFWIISFPPQLQIIPSASILNNRADDHTLVIGDAAVNDSFLAGVDNNERKVDDGVGRWRSVCLLLCLPIPLNQVLKSYLL